MRSIGSLFASFNDRWKSFLCDCMDFRTTSHIVVFESDDWGSIRMSNKKAWDELLGLGYAVDKRPYERFDTLESAEDLEALFNVLGKYKDYQGNHPVITANMLMANPDFERIEKSRYKDYFFEPVSETYKRYYGDDRALELMSQGLSEGVFMPQCHGREHFNVAEWMQGLQAGDDDLLTAFKYGMCGIAPKAHPEMGNNMMVALRARNELEQKQIESIVNEGLQMFENLWGLKSKTFVAPCYSWNEQLEKVLSDNGVQLIQSARVKKNAYKSSLRHIYCGEKNNYGQVYGIRNCKFEPATNEGGASVEALMMQIDSVFKQRKIAIISTHRINYVSGIDKANLSRTLKILDTFLSKLLMKYPDTIFLSSDKLIDIIKK